MPFENPLSEPALTRRSDRLRSAVSPTATDDTTALDSPAAPSPAPISRRAARELLKAAAALSGDTAPAIPMPASPVEVPTVDEATAADTTAAEATPLADEVPAVEAAPLDEDEAADADVLEDAFAEASRIFRALADESESSQASAPLEEPEEPAESLSAVHIAPRRRKGARRAIAVGATIGVMGIAGLLAVSMTLPAEAVAAIQAAPGQAPTSLVAATGIADEKVAADDEIQAFVASSDVENETLTRDDDFSTISLGDLAAEQGIKYSNTLYTNDPDAAIQWPFVVGVGMSSPYGMRNGRLHAGIDLVPGAGAPVQVIADGVVRKATESGGAYGVTVYVDHVIDGQVITSHYSHMQYGSLRVKTGDTIKVGDVVGLVGNTGRSYGAHLHFELIVNGSTIDPLPWMRKNAGRYSY